MDTYKREANIKSRAKRKAHLDELKRDTPCIDCGDNYKPDQMCFMHVRGERPKYNLGTLNLGWQAMLGEIANCDLVCWDCRATRLRGGKSQFSPRKLGVLNVALYQGKIEWRPDLARFEKVSQ